MSTVPTSDIPMVKDDLDRLKAEYASRKTRFSGGETYSPLNLAYLFAIQQRQRDVLKLLRQEGIGPLREQRVLEIGCGYGGVLLEFQGYGMAPGLLHGVDLLDERITRAHSSLP